MGRLHRLCTSGGHSINEGQGLPVGPCIYYAPSFDGLAGTPVSHLSASSANNSHDRVWLSLAPPRHSAASGSPLTCMRAKLKQVITHASCSTGCPPTSTRTHRLAQGHHFTSFLALLCLNTFMDVPTALLHQRTLVRIPYENSSPSHVHITAMESEECHW